MTILVVEDDETARYAAVKVLEVAGYRLISACNHNRALETLEGSEPVHLLVTDIVMPGRANGFALARMASLRRPNLKVLYTTGCAELPQSEIQAALGPILRKPFSRDALLRAVEDAILGERGMLPCYPKRDDKSADAV
jgi:CheY-like chemotaxis protein